MSGFTLIEVIVATVLVSLIMAGLISALGTLGMSASRLEERAGQADDIWQVGELLRFSLSRSVSRLRQPLPDGSKAVFFRGSAQEVTWLGGMPARYGAGGVYHFRLAPSSDRPARLVLQYAPYLGQDNVPDIAQADSHVLLALLTDIRMTYQAKPEVIGQEAVWLDSWDNPEQLPVRIRLDIAAENQIWPPIVISLSAADTGGAGDGRIVAGPPMDD